MKQIFSLLALTALLFTSAVYADDYEDGRAAANRGLFAQAYSLWKPLSDKGDVRATYDLGKMYARGDGVQKDFVTARSYFELAAAKDFGPALLALGKMYYYGDGTTRDYTKAYDYFSRAASRGVGDADGFLQKLPPPPPPPPPSEPGVVSAPPPQGVVALNVPAATTIPQFATPIPNDTPQGGSNVVPPPPSDSGTLTQPPPAGSDPLAAYRPQSPSAVIGTNGRGIRFDPVAEAIILAMPSGQSLLSTYDTSLFYGPLVSDETSLGNYLAEANGGNAEAQNIMGFAALKAGDTDLAQSWFNRSAAQNNGTALFVLGNFAFDSNYARAAEYFSKAANLGIIPAQRNYGYFLLKGIGIDQDVAHAKALLQEAAQRGDVLAADLAK